MSRPTAWNQADRQAFRDGMRLKAQTIPSKKNNGPTTQEWEDDDTDLQLRAR